MNKIIYKVIKKKKKKYFYNLERIYIKKYKDVYNTEDIK